MLLVEDGQVMMEATPTRAKGGRASFRFQLGTGLHDLIDVKQITR